MKRPHVRLVVDNAERFEADPFHELRLQLQRIRHWSRQVVRGVAVAVAIVAACTQGVGACLRVLWIVFTFPFIAAVAIGRFFAAITIGFFKFYIYFVLAACGLGICVLIGYMLLQDIRTTTGH